MQLTSPSANLAVRFFLNEDGSPFYEIAYQGQPLLRPSRLGLRRKDSDFTRSLHLLGASDVESVEDRYEILTAKRRVNWYRAHRQVMHLEAAEGQKMDLIFQVSDDGVAFRYLFPETSPALYHLEEEVTSFHFFSHTLAWLQPMSVAKTFWAETNPAYEEFYQQGIPVGTPSTLGVGWVYPALFRTGETWIALSEGSLSANYCGTRLRTESPDGEYSIGFPDPQEHFQGGPVAPESSLPWLTPWRLIVIGDLPTVAESTLGIDLADPPAVDFDGTIEPGAASWSWVLLKDAHTTYEVQKQFIDYAADMNWKYCLIDGLWDTQIGYEKIRELTDYARCQGVRILLWYNSAGDWNSTHQTPRGKTLTHNSRMEEFTRLRDMGVAGLKIDFFPGDGQSAIGYYLDILKDAAPFGLLINFHGSTLPRGWQRTYPHLMTMEAIRGLEFITFEQNNADQAPSHCAMLPFTRNLFDPMDFTPMVLDRIPGIERRTSSAFELALSVLFTSGIQHYGEIPTGMAKAPEYVREFLRGIPPVWENTYFLAGHPGAFVVSARQGGSSWYIAGINAQSTPHPLTLDLSRLLAKGPAHLITDGDGGNLSFRHETFLLPPDSKVEMPLQPKGGFVITLAL